MRNKIKSESLENKPRKRFPVFVWTIFGLILTVALATAITTITENKIITTGDLNTSRINNIFYVQAGNATDIQAKIDKCPIIGCTVIIPSGEYVFTSSVNLLSNITVKGEGYGTKLIKNYAGGNLFGLSNSIAHSNVEIRDFYADFKGKSGKIFQGNNINNNHLTMSNVHAINGSDLAVNLDGDYIWILNNRIINFSSGIVLEGNYQWIDNNIIIRGNNTVGTDLEIEGIDSNNASHSYAWITNNYVRGFYEEGIDSNHKYSIIANNIVIMPSKIDLSGITLSGNFSKAIGNIIFNSSNSRGGIELHAKCYNCEANSNTIHSNGTGVCMKVDATNSSVSDNVLIGCPTGFQGVGTKTQFTDNKFIRVNTPFSTTPIQGFNFYNDVWNMPNGILMSSPGTGKWGLHITKSSDATAGGLFVKHSSAGGDRIIAQFNNTAGDVLKVTAEGRVSIKGGLLLITANTSVVSCVASSAGTIIFIDGASVDRHSGCNGAIWQDLY